MRASSDFVHTGPGTLAGRYLRLFWQPVFLSRELLPGRAKPIKIMSEEFTLYRGESGQAHLVDFRCAHRGTQLSVGTVEQDAIRCFYHGWKYDATGQCVEQPAEQESSAAKVRIRSFPVRENLGLIYVYLGEGEPPEFPRYRHLEDTSDGFLEVEVIHRRYNYFQNFENSIDSAHLSWVHATLEHTYQGRIDEPQVAAEETIWGLAAISDRPSGRRTVNQIGMPNIFCNKLPSSFLLPGPLANAPGDSYLFCELWLCYVPIDDENHCQFLVKKLSLTGDAAERYREERARQAAKRDLRWQDLTEDVLAGKLRLADVDPTRTEFVYFQDDIAQSAQGRIADRDRERLGRSDNAIVLLRRTWTRELRALAEGRPLKRWTYDDGQLRVQRDIPSPAKGSGDKVLA